MKTFEYTITDPIGIHARPAGLLSKKAKEFEGTRITVHFGDKSADCTRLVRLMAMSIKCGDTISVSIEGPQEEEAYTVIEQFFKENF